MTSPAVLLSLLLSLSLVSSFTFRNAISRPLQRPQRRERALYFKSSFRMRMSDTESDSHALSLTDTLADTQTPTHTDTLTETHTPSEPAVFTVRLPTVLLTGRGEKKYLSRTLRERMTSAEAAALQRETLLDALQPGMELLAKPRQITRYGVFVSPCFEESESESESDRTDENKNDNDTESVSVSESVSEHVNINNTQSLSAMQVATNLEFFLPRSSLTAANLSALSWMRSHDKDRVIVRVTEIDRERESVTAELVKIVREDDLSERFPAHLINRNLSYNGTITRYSEAGLYVFIPQKNVEGLVPANKLFGYSEERMHKIFPINGTIAVQMDEVDTAKNKLLLNIKLPRADVSYFHKFPRDRFFDCIVQGVSNYGLFVRPAGHDCIGLIHGASIPRELIRALKIHNNMSLHREAPLPSLFQPGDIVKARVNQVDLELNKLDLTMLAFVKEDDSLYLGEHARRVETDYVVIDDSIGPLQTLVWYQGKRYTPPVDEAEEKRKKALRLNVLNEVSDEGDPDDVLLDPDEINDRNWRRLFTVALIKRTEEQESRAAQDHADRERREIGAVAGLEELMPEYYCLDEYKEMFPPVNPLILKPQGPIPDWFVDQLNGTFFEKDYRKKHEEITKFHPLTAKKYFEPIFAKQKAQERAKKEERARRRLQRPLSPSDDVVEAPEPAVSTDKETTDSEPSTAEDGEVIEIPVEPDNVDVDAGPAVVEDAHTAPKPL